MATLSDRDAQRVETALLAHNGNVAGAARDLGLRPTTLRSALTRGTLRPSWSKVRRALGWAT